MRSPSSVPTAPACRPRSPGPAGEALAAADEEIALDQTSAGFTIEAGDYADLFQRTIADRTVRRPGLPGVRVRSTARSKRGSPLDRVVLGGLVEGTWPPEPRADPWFSRPMRHALGLDLPERRISLSAHDFAQSLGAGECSSAMPPRLMARRPSPHVSAAAGRSRGRAKMERRARRGERYLLWAARLDRPTHQAPASPQPKPPRAARPVALSVTAIETWLRDPYTIYASIFSAARARSDRSRAGRGRPRDTSFTGARRLYQALRARAATTPVRH